MKTAKIYRKQIFADLSGVAALAAVLLAIAVLATYLTSDYSQRIILLIALNSIFVLSLGLGNGFTGVFSLGHVGFIAIGAYVSGIISMPVEVKTSMLPHLPHYLQMWSISFLPATLISGVCAAFVALLVGLPLMRLSGHFVTVATMGFLIIVHEVILNAADFTRGARTFTGVPLDTNIAWTFAWLFVTIIVIGRIVHSGIGLLIRAGRDDNIAASGLGVNVMWCRLFAFTVGGFFAGIGGSLYAHYLGSFSPHSFYWGLTIKLIVMLVLGGMGSLSGAIVGVVLVTILSEVLQTLESGIDLGFVHIPALFGASQVALGIIFILVMIYRPKGILSEREFNFRFLRPPI